MRQECERRFAPPSFALYFASLTNPEGKSNTMSNNTTEFPVMAEVSLDGGSVVVTFAYNPKRVQAVKRVPSARFIRKEHEEGPGWRLNKELATMKRLREVFGKELGLGLKLKVWGRAEVDKANKLSEMSQADDAELDNIPAHMFDSDTEVDGRVMKLREYQKADIKFMAHGNVLNANQPGAGKSIETIGALIESGLEWGQHLVFAPVTSLRTVWETEIKQAYQWAGFDEPIVLTGDTPNERREAIAEAKRLAEEDVAFWLVLNPAMARLKRVKKGSGDSATVDEELVSPELIEVDWDSIVIDEYHLMGLSNPTTLSARGVNEIAEITQPAKRYALSGTPMGGKPIKLWGALHFLDPERFTSRWNWARTWLVINNNGYGHSIEGIMPGREEDFYNELKPYLVRRTKKEALPGLPPKNTINVWCQMTAKQFEQYKQFATEAEWRIADAEEGDRLTATNVLAEYMRLKQFANAYSEVERTGRERDGVPELKVTPTTDSAKLEQLMEKLAEENVLAAGADDDEPRKAIVFSQFNGMVEMVAQALEDKGVPAATIDGGVTGKKRTELVRAFQHGGSEGPRVLVMNTMAGGSSINLSTADSVHILDETWVPDNQEQAEDRAHRGDDKTMAKDEVRIYYYRTRNSIDEYIRTLVAGKQMNNKTILDLRRRMQKQLAEAEAESGE